MQHVLRYASNHKIRVALARILADACALAGWLALDQGKVRDSWNYYEDAKNAARESESDALIAYACAAQSVVLLDVGELSTAIDLPDHARRLGGTEIPNVLRSWLTAAYGEACAADGQHTQSLDAFHEAGRLISRNPGDSEAPYLVFGEVHLARWHGNALARLGDREAFDVLSLALERLDPTFVRAETVVLADMVEVLLRDGEPEAAARHAERCLSLTSQIGSVRQRRRIERLTRR